MSSDRASTAMIPRSHPLDTLLLRLAAAAALALVVASPAAAGGIAIVSGDGGAPYVEAIGGLLEGLAELGITEQVAVHQLPEETGNVAALTADATGAPADLVVALGSRAAARAISTLPATTPVVTGLLLRLTDLRPAPNVTGVSLEIPIATQLDWLRRLLPQARAVGVLYDPAVNGQRVEDARRAAAQLGLRLEAVPVPRPVDLPGALEAVARRADVLLGIPDGLVLGPESARSVLLFSLRNRIPFVGLSEAWVKAGALYALEPDYRDIGRQCAELAAKVMGGDAPRALTSQSPRRVSVTYNRRTMELLGLELPSDVLASARAVD